MSISLTDIPAAVADYLSTEVITSVSPVVPSDPQQDVLTPGQEGHFTVTVTNGQSTKGIRLTDVLYHLQVHNPEGKTVLQLVSPGNLIIVGFEDKDASTVLKPDSKVTEMFVRKETASTIEAGDTDELDVTVTCLTQGTPTITANILADVDQSELFPTSRNKKASVDVDVK